MKILVTGKSGQVVTSLLELAGAVPDVELVAAGRPELDLEDRASVMECIAAARPDIVVSAAAYTAVDRAEEEPDRAYAVNVVGAAAVAEAAERVGAACIHLSTDYVFSGAGTRPYREDCATGPQTVYGQTKLEGERAVALTGAKHVILRTSWVYSPFGVNFVKTMLSLAEDRDTVAVVADQWGKPTSALDIADAILWIAPRLRDGRFGLYHLAGAGETNWAGLARHVFQASRESGGPFAEVKDVSSAEYPARARRPHNSRLSSEKFERTFLWRAPDWRSSVEQVVARLAGPLNGRRVFG